MGEQQVAIVAGKEFYEFIIRQAGLYRDSGKIFAIEFLYALGKTYPAKIVFIHRYITNGALQQAFIYAVAKRIIPAYRLSFYCLPAGC
jgi:hypothetical protein